MFIALALSAALATGTPFASLAATTHSASLAATTPPPPLPVADLAREARAAYDKGDKATFLKNYEEIAKRRPGDAYVLYNLACAQALNGRTADAERTLLEIAELNVMSDLDADADFDSIRQTEGYQRAKAKMAALRTERVTSNAAVAFRVPEKGLVPEGVAYDPVSKSFFVSSIRKRKVFRVDASGRVSEFVRSREGGLRTAAGIGVDPKRRSLWVASEAMPHMEGYTKDEPKASALFEFDADTGALRREIRPPMLTKPAAFDDLTVAADGRVYVNDAESGRIWTLPPGGKALEVFLETPVIRGTQGLAADPNGRAVYVSDYSGLYRVDTTSKQLARLAVPAGVALNGVDGLVYAGGSLYGVQNGVEPNRVIRVDLAADGVTVTGGKILEMNHPDFDEPTLAAAAEGFLYVVADSQGGKFRDEKHPIAPDAMREAVVLKIPIAGGAR